MKVLFACGTVQMIDPDKGDPVCAHCGIRQVARTVGAVRRPSFVGHARGPLVETQFLGPRAVSLSTAGPLSVKDADAK